MNKTISRLALGTATAVLMTMGSLAPAKADTVLKFISWQTDDAGTGEWWHSAIAAFEKQHPGVKIEFTKAERSSYADTMTTLLRPTSRRRSCIWRPSNFKCLPIAAGSSRSTRG